MARRDPLRNFKFIADIGGTRTGFKKVTGLTRSTEVIDYREGGENETPRKLPGQTSFGPIVLERGKVDSTDTEFIDWCNEIFDLDASPTGQHADAGIRRTVTITLRDKSGTTRVVWTCSNCWPSEYKSGDLDADANEVVIDSLTLQTEGIKEVKQ